MENINESQTPQKLNDNDEIFNNILKIFKSSQENKDKITDLQNLKDSIQDESLINYINSLITFIEDTEKKRLAELNKRLTHTKESQKQQVIDQSATQYKNTLISDQFITEQIDRFLNLKTRNDQEQSPSQQKNIKTYKDEFDKFKKENGEPGDLSSLFKAFSPKCSLDRNQVETFCQALNIRYCEDNKANGCPIKFENLSSNIKGGGDVLGMYSWEDQCITLNKEFLTQPNSNPNFSTYKLLETIIHESQHRVQHNAIAGVDTSIDKNLVSDIKNSISSPEFISADYKKYFVRPEEQDARNEAIKTLTEFAQEEDLKNFVKNLAKAEKSNQDNYNSRHLNEDTFPYLHTKDPFVKKAEIESNAERSRIND